MAKHIATCATLLAIGFGPNITIAENGPVIVGDAERSECQIALEIADKAFHSSSYSMVWPVRTIPPHDIVVMRDSEDISAGPVLQVGTDVFETYLLSQTPDPTYHVGLAFWQRRPADGQRVVVTEQPFNWAGSWFGLFSIPANVTSDAFIKNYSSSVLRDISALTNVWSPPIVLRNPASNTLWAIDTGVRSASFVDWTVLILSSDGFTSPCHIALRQKEAAGLALLSQNVKQFADLADEALGPGTNEGTLRPTARIRNRIQVDWQTVTERPWALTISPYNTHEEVDAGLAAWAQVNPDRALLYQELQSAYSKAESDLAHFYSERFSLSPEDASVFSTFAMDYMLRRHFVFHRTSSRQLALITPPWPAGLR